MSHPVLSTKPLDSVWHTADPFLFCVHHDDAYPRGNDRLGPDASLAGRDMGSDFAGLDGWRMYHGRVVPGFPQHPHRGFETITIARRGLIDHSDSLGATGRFGGGDVQWMTAGRGIVHSEMFPLLNPDEPNHMEMFQIWINLPSENKLVPAHYKMLWRDEIHTVESEDAGRTTRITIVAGSYEGATPPSPPPHSWASRDDSDVAVWTIELDPGATWQLPPANAGTNRTLYFFSGSSLRVAGMPIQPNHGVTLDPELPAALQAGDEGPVEALLLQGRPIDEPVAHYGPFVMNTQAELRQTMVDYQRTGFGGWPWDRSDPVHPREAGRFARHADGTEEKRT
jgi:redox-sensitive bicupin YhaK (pirin superfamily)